jgi:predicted RNase H-like HicB family nuclease
MKVRHFCKGGRMSHEIIFYISQSEEGGYSATAADHPIFSEADTIDDLKENIKDAVRCHFEGEIVPKTAVLRYRAAP